MIFTSAPKGDLSENTRRPIRPTYRPLALHQAGHNLGTSVAHPA